jgi:hypothetical protein
MPPPDPWFTNALNTPSAKLSPSLTAFDIKYQTNICLRPEQVKQLKALNQKTGAPVAELERRASGDEYLLKNEREVSKKRDLPVLLNTDTSRTT